MHLITAAPTSTYDPHHAHLTSLTSRHNKVARRRGPIGWGIVIGVLQGASPLALWWLEPATVHGISIAFIAAIYVGFAVSDGRPAVIAVESAVALGFVVLAAAGVVGSAWLLVVGYAGHGIKDLWQHRHEFVRGTRWWPPFCAAVDFVVAAILVAEIAAGVAFHH
jgi:hypothetical protein